MQQGRRTGAHGDPAPNTSGTPVTAHSVMWMYAQDLSLQCPNISNGHTIPDTSGALPRLCVFS